MAAAIGDHRPGRRDLDPDIVRFLEQSTFGPTPDLVAHVGKSDSRAFLDEQFDAPTSSYPTLPLYPTTRDTVACPNGSTCQRDNYTQYPPQTRFFQNALYGPDQLRQRVAFALHQILVVSGVEITQPSWMAPYLQTLDRHAFGNYRQLLYEITLNPAMGNYLDVNGNTRTRPNENYAREVLQLFSIGTARLNPDGTPQLDEAGQTIPTYTQATVNNFARVFTGWRFATAPRTGVPNYIDSMVPNEAQHDVAAKTLLNGAVLPPGQNTKDLDDAIDNIFNHPNVGPFVSKQLIQHLVTSNPTPAYVARVTSVFDGEGAARAAISRRSCAPSCSTRKREATSRRISTTAVFATRCSSSPTSCARLARGRPTASASDGYLNPQSLPWEWMCSARRRCSATLRRHRAYPVRGSSRPRVRAPVDVDGAARLNFVNTIVFSRINVGTNAPSGTSLDFSPLLPLRPSQPASSTGSTSCSFTARCPMAMRSSVVLAVTAVPASNTLKRARTAAYLVLTSSQYQVER